MKKLFFAIVTTLFLTIFISTNHASAATTLQFGKTESGILQPGDRKVFEINVPSDGKVRLDGETDDSRVDFWIRDLDGNIVIDLGGFSNAEKGNPRKGNESSYLEKGKYEVVVDEGDYGEYDSKYSLKATFTSSKTNDVEPNNGTDFAQKITLNKTKITGQLGYADKVDYFKFTLPKSGYLALNTISYLEYVDYYILDENYDEVDSIEVYGTEASPNSQAFGHYLEKGTYYIKVERENKYIGVYSMRPTFEAASTNEIEPNNGMNEAQLIKANVQKIKGLLTYQESKDVFKVKVTKSGSLTVDATVYPSDTTISIYNSHYESLEDYYFNQYYNGTSESKRFSTSVKPGIYYIEVYSRSKSGLYNFSVKVPQMLPKAPSVSKITTKSKVVTGTTYKNSKVKVKIGSKFYTTKSTSKGKFSVKIPAQKAKKAVYVSVTTSAGTSAYKKVVVKK